MTRKVELPKRRRLLGVMGSASFAALAGCGSSGDDDGDTEEQEAQFDVSISSTNQPVADGTILKVTVTVENTGEEEATDEVMFTVGDLQRSTSLTLGPGEQQDVDFEGRLSIDQAEQTFEVTVETTNGSDSREVSVFKESFFAVELESITDDLVAGELFEATVRVENSGGEETTQTVRLDVVGMEDDPDSAEVTLEPGESTTVTLEWVTEGATWVEEVAIKTDDDSVSNQITVKEDAIVNFTIVGVNTPLVEGETLNADVEVRNESGAEDTVSVALDIPGIEDDVDSTDVTVGGESSRTVTLSWVVDDTTANEIRVRMRDEAQTRDILVRKAASFEFELQDAPDSVYPGEAVEVEVLVKNTGEVEGTTEIALTGPDGETDSRSLTIFGGVQNTETLEWVPGADHVGTQSLTVEYSDGSEQVDVTVEYPLELGEHEVIETHEDFGELMTVTVENVSSVEFPAVVEGEIKLEDEDSPFTNRTGGLVPGNDSREFTLKIHTGTNFGFRYEAFETGYTSAARLDKEAESVTDTPGYDRLALKDIEWNNDDTNNVLELSGTVENLTESDASGTIMGMVSIAVSSDEIRWVDNSIDVDVASGESQSFDLTVDYQVGVGEEYGTWRVGFKGIIDGLDL
jgi:hypothetical protein